MVERKPGRPPEKRETTELLAFSVFFGRPIIFTDPDGKLELDEPGQEELTASPQGSCGLD